MQLEVQCRPGSAISMQHDSRSQALRRSVDRSCATRLPFARAGAFRVACTDTLGRYSTKCMAAILVTFGAAQRLPKVAPFVHRKCRSFPENNGGSRVTRGETTGKRKQNEIPSHCGEHLRPMTCLPWNKPKPGRLAWQARCSSLLGRRTGAGRLYSQDGHRGMARFERFARTRIRGFEEVLRARNGRA